ncbi:MAG TPA: hypothetical protein VGQ83_19825 [Polyangia bacterium]
MIFIVAVGGTLLILVVGLVLGWTVGNRRRARAWADSARRLGLALAPFPASRVPVAHLAAALRSQPPSRDPSYRDAMHGARGGLTVVASIAESGNNDVPWRSFSTTCYALLPAPLGVGLQLTRHGFALRLLGEVLARPPLRTGHPIFDDAFRLHADDPARAVWLVSQVAVDLMQALRFPGELTVSDDGVELELKGAATDATRLGPALDLVAHLAGRLAAAAGPA